MLRTCRRARHALRAVGDGADDGASAWLSNRRSLAARMRQPGGVQHVLSELNERLDTETSTAAALHGLDGGASPTRDEVWQMYGPPRWHLCQVVRDVATYERLVTSLERDDDGVAVFFDTVRMPTVQVPRWRGAELVYQAKPALRGYLMVRLVKHDGAMRWLRRQPGVSGILGEMTDQEAEHLQSRDLSSLPSASAVAREES